MKNKPLQYIDKKARLSSVSSQADQGMIGKPKEIALWFVLLQFGTTVILSVLLLAHSAQVALSSVVGGMAVVFSTLAMARLAFRHQGSDKRYLIVGLFGVGQVTKVVVCMTALLVAHQALTLSWPAVIFGMAQAQLVYLWGWPLLMREKWQ